MTSESRRKEGHKDRFEVKLQEYIDRRKIAHIKTKEAYNEIVKAVKKWELGERFPEDEVKRNYGRRFHMQVVNNKEELMHNEAIVVYDSRIFEILYIVHITGGCSGRDLMWPKVKGYFGITQQLVIIFIKCCALCPLKRGKAKKGLVIRPLITTEHNERCQVDLIDLQSIPDGDYRFLLNYQDHLTKFSVLRALKTKTAVEVAQQISSIFCLLGPPKLLQTDNGKEFENAKLKEMLRDWPGCQLIHGRPRHSQSQGSVERSNRDVQDILFTEMKRRDTGNWTELVDKVQLIKNSRYHRGIERSPFKALFGFDANHQEFAHEFDQEVPVVDDLPQDESTMLEPEEEVPWRTNQDAAIGTERDEASQALQRQANRMLQASNNRYGAIEVGKTVLVGIPDVDRPKAGARSLMAVVLEKKNGFYRLGTKSGCLPNWFSRNQVDPVEEPFLLAVEVPDVKLPSFRAAVSLDSVTGEQGHHHCNCNGKCDTNRCSCKARNLQCNSRCHKANSNCYNK